MKRRFINILSYIGYYLPGIIATTLVILAFLQSNVVLYLTMVGVDLLFALIIDMKFDWGGKHFVFWTLETVVAELSVLIFYIFGSFLMLYLGIILCYVLFVKFEDEIIEKIKTGGNNNEQ